MPMHTLLKMRPTWELTFFKIEVKSRERSLDVDQGKDVGSSTSSSSAGVDSNWAHDVTLVL